MAHMDISGVVRQLNVVTSVVAENIELRDKLVKAQQIIGQLQALLQEYEAKEAAAEPAEDGEKDKE